MAGKFKMSNGIEDLLGRQAADTRDPFQKGGLPKRNALRDTEHERMPVKPLKGGSGDTAFINRCQEASVSNVMEHAMMDKMAEAMRQGAVQAEGDEDLQEEEITQEEVDNAEDNRNVDDDDLEAIRAARIRQMQEKFEKQQKYKAAGHGCYDEIVEEDFLKTATSSDRAVIHFYHRGFEKCKIIDMHLGKCAKKFIGTKFAKIDAEKAPFFVDKLKVRTLPCVVVFKDGKSKNRQLGFEGLGGEDFSTVQLAWRFKEWGGIEEDFGPDDEDLFD